MTPPDIANHYVATHKSSSKLICKFFKLVSSSIYHSDTLDDPYHPPSLIRVLHRRPSYALSFDNLILLQPSKYDSSFFFLYYCVQIPKCRLDILTKNFREFPQFL